MKAEIIKLAQDEIGYLEKSKDNYSLYGSECLYPKTKYAGADNYTKYSWELRTSGNGHPNGQYWCMTFICWLFYKICGAEEANKLLCGKLSSPSVLDVKDAMVNAGRQVPLNTAKPGDIVFRSRSGGGHVGLVVGRDASGKIITVEGNTDVKDTNSWNGGGVAQHTAAKWEWCCRPAYPEDKGFRWVHSDGKWYWQDEEGRNWHGWCKIKETSGEKWHWYWFDWDGAAATGEKFVDGHWWFFWPDRDQNECMLCITDDKGALLPWTLDN